MGDTSSGAGEKLKSTSPTNVSIFNEKKPNPQVVRALTDFKIMAVERFPELKGQIYNELNKLVQADFSKPDTLGVYSQQLRKIAIASRITGNQDKVRDTVAHELAHALTSTTRIGFRSYDDTFSRAFREYSKTHRTASELSFARSITHYAGSSREEAFAEAFSDYFRNGKNAKTASKLMMKHWKK